MVRERTNKKLHAICSYPGIALPQAEIVQENNSTTGKPRLARRLAGFLKSAASRTGRLADRCARTIWILIFLLPAFGQTTTPPTTINLQTQGRNPDFSNFSFTRPASVGTSLPATCQVGQFFFNSAAAPGSNLLVCSATNVWSLVGGQPSGNYLTALSGDGTASGPGSATLTLASVNSNPGTCGDATHVCQLSTNTKGLVIGQSAIAISGGSNPASCNQMAYQLTDFQTAFSSTSGGTLTINGTASATSPSTIQVGNSSYSFTQPASAFVTGPGSGTAYVYIDPLGNLSVGSNIAINCIACTYVTGVSSFPLGSRALWTWTISNGAFTANGGTDYRSFLSYASTQVSAPATSSSSCITGEWAADANYYYSCVANNSWKRAALSSF